MLQNSLYNILWFLQQENTKYGVEYIGTLICLVFAGFCITSPGGKKVSKIRIPFQRTVEKRGRISYNRT
jgi:hypothetical protein